MSKGSESVKGCRERWRAAGLCYRCGAEREDTKYTKCEKCRQLSSKYACEWQRRLHERIIQKLGGTCFCCGETELMFLTIDHINDDGAAHIREVTPNNTRGGGWKVWKDIERQGCPPDKYRVACYNCNSGRYRNGGVCPHQTSGGLALAA